MEIINILNNKATGGLFPDITILMDCAEDIGIKRALERNKDSLQEGQGRFEKEKMEFHYRVRQGYLTLADKNRDRYIVIDASKTVDEVERDIIKPDRLFRIRRHTERLEGFFIGGFQFKECKQDFQEKAVVIDIAYVAENSPHEILPLVEG